MKFFRSLSALGLGIILGYFFFHQPVGEKVRNDPPSAPIRVDSQPPTFSGREGAVAEPRRDISPAKVADAASETPLPPVSEIRGAFRRKLERGARDQQLAAWCAYGKRIVPVLCKADAAECDGPVYDEQVIAFAAKLGVAATEGFADYILEVIETGECRQIEIPLPDNTTVKREAWFGPDRDDRTDEVVELSYRQLAKAEKTSPEILKALRLGMWHKNAVWRCAALKAAGILGEKVKDGIAPVLLDPAYEHLYRAMGWCGGESAAGIFAKWRLGVEPTKNREQLYALAAEPNHSAECGDSLLYLAQYDADNRRLPELLLSALENPATVGSAARGIAVMGARMAPYRGRIAELAKTATGLSAHWLKSAVKEIESEKSKTRSPAAPAEVF